MTTEIFIYLDWCDEDGMAHTCRAIRDGRGKWLLDEEYNTSMNPFDFDRWDGPGSISYNILARDGAYESSRESLGSPPPSHDIQEIMADNARMLEECYREEIEMITGVPVLFYEEFLDDVHIHAEFTDVDRRSGYAIIDPRTGEVKEGEFGNLSDGVFDEEVFCYHVPTGIEVGMSDCLVVKEADDDEEMEDVYHEGWIVVADLSKIDWQGREIVAHYLGVLFEKVKYAYEFHTDYGISKADTEVYLKRVMR